jgi:maltose O-acetyltransferase
LIRIGPRCAIGSHAIIIDNDLHTIDPGRRYDTSRRRRRSSSRKTCGSVLGVIVLRGVTIGAHSVIGAGSVVTSNIAPRSVAVGVPARVVKSI